MRLLRPLATGLALGAGLLTAACGSGGDERVAAPPPKVALTVQRPADLSRTREATVTVAGSVEPADASVQVGGRAAEVAGGRFSTTVDLERGDNVIDVSATARGRSPALTAFRVTRELPVVVPDVSGLTADAARGRLEPLGLALSEERAGGLLEELLPGEPAVCEQEPAAGDEVERGTRVAVHLSKRC